MGRGERGMNAGRKGNGMGEGRSRRDGWRDTGWEGWRGKDIERRMEEGRRGKDGKERVGEEREGVGEGRRKGSKREVAVGKEEGNTQRRVYRKEKTENQGIPSKACSQ